MMTIKRARAQTSPGFSHTQICVLKSIISIQPELAVLERDLSIIKDLLVFVGDLCLKRTVFIHFILKQDYEGVFPVIFRIILSDLLGVSFSLVIQVEDIAFMNVLQTDPDLFTARRQLCLGNIGLLIDLICLRRKRNIFRIILIIYIVVCALAYDLGTDLLYLREF